jgi:hypothetical protein
VAALVYDDALHQYTYNKIIVPSVTQVMKTRGLTKNYSGIDPAVVNTARIRGKAVHKAIELYNQDNLDESQLDIEIPYFNAYKKFEEEYQPIVLQSELQLMSLDWWYAGTMDMVLAIEGRIGVVDTKCTYTLDKDATQIQLAAYKQLYQCQLRGRREKIDFVAALHLQKTGKYNFVVWDNTDTAWEIFTYALNITKWALERGRDKYE